MSSDKNLASKGLAGVVFDETKISQAIPDQQLLLYRGYPASELATKCSFEEVVYLLWHGELPTNKQLESFCNKERRSRTIFPHLLSVIDRFSKDAHPMDALRTAVSFLGLERDYSLIKGEDHFENAFSLLGQVPTLVAALHRKRLGLEPIGPDPKLDFTSNFFNMCFGSVPDKLIRHAFDGSLTLYAEHGFNASTFTARVITSSLSDMCGAVTGAIASLKGPLHGGANEAVMYMLKAIETPEAAEKWLDEALENKRKIMGFGHRLYTSGDSRVPTMKQFRDEVSSRTGINKWVSISKILEEKMIEKKGIYPNLDFPAGPTYHMMGFETDFFTPIFVMARISGWVAHIVEQFNNNKLVRPLSAYMGENQRELIPIAKRG